MKAPSSIALFMVFAGVACSGERSFIEASLPTEAQGSVGLRLRPVAGINLNEVHFVVSKGATLVTQGDLPTPGTAQKLEFALGLPVGNGYTVSVSGASADPFDDVTCTGSFGPFNIMPNQSVDVSISLLCVDNSMGGVDLHANIETEACPRLIIDYAIASPAQARFGDPIQFFSSATELDGVPIVYSWSVDLATAGSFAAPKAANTAFTCLGSADRATATVTADNGQCDKTLDVVFSCIMRECGDGVLDPGEDCEPVFGPCPADCTVTCGDGVVEAPLEECDPPLAGSCTELCQTL